MELRMIKLVSGDVVIGEDISETSDNYRLKKPMLLMLDPMQGGVGMMPYDAIYTQEEPEEEVFAHEHVIHGNMKIHSTFEDAYIKQTTGIEVVQPEIIA